MSTIPIHSHEESRIIQGAVGTGLPGISHGRAPVYSSAQPLLPLTGLRRTIDMTWVQILLWPHLFYAWWSPVRSIYYGISMASWALMRRGDTRGAMIAHMILTACANLSLTVLYAYPLLYLNAPSS